MTDKAVKTAEYQGWKNYESWAVALHIDNDEGLQNMVMEWAQEAVAGGAEHQNTKEGVWTADESAKFTLAEQIKEFVEDQNPLSEGDSGMYGDLLSGAISDVDWDEVAEHYLSTAAEISANTPAAKEGSVTTAAPKKNKPAPKKAPVKKAPEAPTAPEVKPEAVVPAAPTAASFDESGVVAEMNFAVGADDAEVVRTNEMYGNTVYETKVDGTTYTVVESEDAAEEIAKAQVKEDLENDPEIFNKDFIQQHIEIYETDRRIIAGEEADALYDDRDEDEIKEEYARDFGDVDPRMNLKSPEELEAYEKEHANDADPVEKDVETMREELKDSKSSEIYEALKDPIQYFVTDNGMYSIEDLLKASFIRIDIESAAEEAVRIDGWAHFLSRYDGNYETTAAGFVYWRED